MDKSKLKTIGRTEKVDFPKLGLFQVPAKTDTGADVSSIWASLAEENDGHLKVVLFGKDSPFFSGEVLVFLPDEYTIAIVANSFGEKEIRYRVKLSVRVQGVLIKGSFTLADRSMKSYPILLGRKLLQNKFIVDVRKGIPISKNVKAKKLELSDELNKFKDQSK